MREKFKASLTCVLKEYLSIFTKFDIYKFVSYPHTHARTHARTCTYTTNYSFYHLV